MERIGSTYLGLSRARPGECGSVRYYWYRGVLYRQDYVKGETTRVQDRPEHDPGRLETFEKL